MTVRLIDTWRVTLRRAWSVRLIAIAALFSGLETAIGVMQAYDIDPHMPRGLFAGLAGLVSIAAFVSRFISQQPQTADPAPAPSPEADAPADAPPKERSKFMALIFNKRAGVAAGSATAGVGVAALAATLITHWEGEDLVAKHNYFDPKGVYTACDGLTNYDMPELRPGMRFTHAQCQKLLADALPRYAAPVTKCVPEMVNYPPHRQAALISFSYNLGPARICKSGIAAQLNKGHFKTACTMMKQYIRANGVVLKGLVNRRSDPVWGEQAWCMRND